MIQGNWQYCKLSRACLSAPYFSSLLTTWLSQHAFHVLPSTLKRSQEPHEYSTQSKTHFYITLDRSSFHKSFRQLTQQYAPIYRWKDPRTLLGSPSTQSPLLTVVISPEHTYLDQHQSNHSQPAIQSDSSTNRSPCERPRISNTS